MGQDSSGVAHSTLLEGQQPVVEDDYTYSTVDDLQPEMLPISGNPAYKLVPEHDQQPLEEDDPVYSNIDQPETVVSPENPKHGTAPTAAASAK